MKPGKVYTMTWDTVSVPSSTGGANRVDSQTITVNIFDNAIQIPDDDDAQTFTLQPAAVPLEIEVIDNDESKFKPIRAKQARIRFISQQDEGLDFSLFARGYDNQFYVTIGGGSGSVIFLGYLVLPDNQTPFLPDPQTVEITASDHLPLLKDIVLQDEFGDNISGKYRIADIIRLCLAGTGLSLPVNVINNLRMGTGSRSSSSVTFAASGNTITVNFYIGFFYVGQVVTVSGSVSNNGTYRVVSINSSTQITVDGTLTNETTTIYSVTFTDESSGGHLYDTAYLDAKTFEASIGESIDRYSALERILRDDCVLFQRFGQWWIVRIDEYDSNGLYVARFNADGELIQTPTLTDLDVSIGFNESVLFANANQEVRANRPQKYVKTNYSYIPPAEIICNIDFSRGDFVENLPNEVVDNQALEAKKYQLECWDTVDIDQDTGAESAAATMEAYIKKLSNFQGYEKQKYAVLTNGTYDADVFMAIKSQPIPIGQGDKFNFSADWKMPTQLSGSTQTRFNAGLFVLEGVDGVKYAWARDIDGIGEIDLKWRTFADIEGGIFEFVSIEDGFIPDDIDTTVFRNVSVEVDGVPVSGELFIYLYNINKPSPLDSDVHWTNVRFEYIAYINGSYQVYTGQSNKVVRTSNDYAAKIEETVEISDAPRPIFKGGIFFETGGEYVLSQLYYPAAKYAIIGTPEVQQIRPYGWHQVFSVWSQYRNSYTIITGDVWGLPVNAADLCNRFVLTDPHDLLVNRYFMLISFSQDWKTGIWKATFAEVFNSDEGKEYATPFEFKYITDGVN